MRGKKCAGLPFQASGDIFRIFFMCGLCGTREDILGVLFGIFGCIWGC